jgi:hypothetical protein
MPKASDGSRGTDLRDLRRELEGLRQDNARLERLLGLTGSPALPEEQARRPICDLAIGQLGW